MEINIHTYTKKGLCKLRRSWNVVVAGIERMQKYRCRGIHCYRKYRYRERLLTCRSMRVCRDH